MTRSNPGRLLRGAGLTLFATLVAACSSTGGGSGGGGGGGGPNLITYEQIQEAPEGTALTVIQRYRSTWLRARSQGGFAGGGPDTPVVFVDEIRYGDLDSLARIPSTSIETIQFISATDATSRYGTGYPGGIIRVNTITGR